MVLSLKTLFVVLALICWGLKFVGVPIWRLDLFTGGFLFAFLAFVVV
jgi:hypothetical protein